MSKPMLIILALIVVAAAIIVVYRWTDKSADSTVWRSLAARQPSAPDLFDREMLAELPEPARRFFGFAIKPGTPLYTVAEVSMKGDFSLGSKEKPNYMPMTAEQILASPYGFVWNLSAGKGLMRFLGSDVGIDGESWSRFWLLGAVPVARVGGNLYHLKSTFGRYIAEAIFWTPAALLPSDNVVWKSTGESSARVTVTYMGLEQTVDMTVDSLGRPIQVVFPRWSNANAQGEFKLQPFGGYLSEFKDFNGFQLPTRVEAGNFFGTKEYFPFYRVNVTDIRFPQ